MILIDTTIWISVYRDHTKQAARHLRELVGEETVATNGFVKCEVLQGTRDLKEWGRMEKAFQALIYIDVEPQLFVKAARIYFDLQRLAVTPRSTIDCLIAQMCLDHDCTLMHCDRDFERIATIRPLKLSRVEINQGRS